MGCGQEAIVISSLKVTMTTETIYVTSDLHIGYERSNYEKITKFFQIAKNEADRIILNGDIVDLWRQNYLQITIEHTEILETIRDIAKDTPVIWVLGNHDWRIPVDDFPNVEFYTKYDHAGVHYIHGWQFDLQTRKYHWAWDWIVNFYPPLYQKFFKSPSEVVIEEDAIAWLPMHVKAMDYGIKNNINVVVGHSHHPNVKRVASHFVADCGDFVDSCSYLVIDEDHVRIEKI